MKYYAVLLLVGLLAVVAAKPAAEPQFSHLQKVLEQMIKRRSFQKGSASLPADKDLPPPPQHGMDLPPPPQHGMNLPHPPPPQHGMDLPHPPPPQHGMDLPHPPPPGHKPHSPPTGHEPHSPPRGHESHHGSDGPGLEEMGSFIVTILSTPLTRAAPLSVEELNSAVTMFERGLDALRTGIRAAADTFRSTDNLVEVARKVLQSLGEVGQEAAPMNFAALSLYTRAMVYGINDKIVCELGKVTTPMCVGGRLELMRELGKRFKEQQRSGEEPGCKASLKSNTRDAIAQDFDCIADNVGKIRDFISSARQTVTEEKLVGMLELKPPKDMNLSKAAAEVLEDIDEEMVGIVRAGGRIATDIMRMANGLQKLLV